MILESEMTPVKPKPIKPVSIKNSELAPVKIASQTRKSIFTTPVTGDKDGLVSCSLCGRYEIFNNLYNLIIE